MLDGKSVGQIARNVGQVYTVKADTMVAGAIEQLRTEKVGCVVVEDAECKVVGILSERDVIGRAVAVSADLDAVRVSEIMTSEVVSCTMETPIVEVQALMAEHGIRHVPILQDGKAAGMLSSRDVVVHQLSTNMAMQAAAEQVAMLSKNFKSLDYEEILHLLTREVPKIFGAEWGVLCFPSNIGDGSDLRVVSRNRCNCSEKTLGLEAPRDASIPIDFHGFPEECFQIDGEPPRAVFRLPIYAGTDDQDGSPPVRYAYLCMCHLSPSAAASKELLSYKATLLQGILAVNLMNARLYDRARRESEVDTLTGTKTRRVFEECLEGEHERAVRCGHAFCVAIVDVDNFKGLNDRNGHPEGDQVLRLLGAALRQGVRRTDVLARYGGDEFVVLMPETSLGRGKVVLERLRAATYSVVAGVGEKVTISCGIAEWTGDASETGTEVLRRADAALYEAKRSGRNRVVTGAV